MVTLITTGKRNVKDWIRKAGNVAKKGQFWKVCRSKSKKGKDPNENEEESNMLFALRADEMLASISTAVLLWDRKTKRWLQRPSSLTRQFKGLCGHKKGRHGRTVETVTA